MVTEPGRGASCDWCNHPTADTCSCDCHAVVSGRFLSPCCSTEPLGHEVRGVYDGVLFWSCTACGHAWNRWEGGFGFRYDRAQSYVDAINAARTTPARTQTS